MLLYLEQITDDLRLTVHLDHDASPAGTFVHPGQDQIHQLDNLVLRNDGVSEVMNDGVNITGRTDSKLYAIINTIKNIALDEDVMVKKVGNQFGEAQQITEFDPKRFLNIPIHIAGTDITATISVYENARKEYTLYSDTEYPIKYVDFPDGTTTFSFSKIAEESNINTPLLNKYSGLVEEPKIESSVFIERGTVNVFESFTKLKKVKSLNEMTKFGFGYFKINKQGFNF